MTNFENQRFAELERRLTDMEGVVSKRFSAAIPASRRVTIKAVIEVVCQHYGVNEAEIMSEARPARLVRPRHVAWYLCREITRLPLTSIAREFNRKEHGSIYHGHRSIKRRMRSDDDLRDTLAELRVKVNAAREQNSILPRNDQAQR